MERAADRYLRLLAEEREAARRADVEALVRIQARKEAELDAVRAEGLEASEAEAIAARSRANLRLLRHLSECLRAMASAGEPPAAGGYDQRGRRAAVAGGSP